MIIESRIGLVLGLGLLSGMSGILALSQEKDIQGGEVVVAAEAAVEASEPVTMVVDPEVGPASPEDDPGGVYQLLRRIRLGYEGPVADLVSDSKRFESFFPPAAEGPTIAGDKVLRRPDDLLVDGATLAFPKGVFRLRNLMHYRRWFPKGVTIRGAGMDETLLYMDTVRSQGPVHNLRVQDCTLFVPGTILDLSEGIATLLCERVRFMGFDTRPQGRPTPALSMATAALYFRECRFEGGYGDHPSHGALLHGSLLARFERCRFSRLHLEFPGDPATVVFVDCVLQDLCGDPRPRAARNEGTRFHDCKFENHWLPHQRRRLLPLEVLFPGWRERLVE